MVSARPTGGPRRRAQPPARERVAPSRRASRALRAAARDGRDSPSCRARAARWTRRARSTSSANVGAPRGASWRLRRATRARPAGACPRRASRRRSPRPTPSSSKSTASWYADTPSPSPAARVPRTMCSPPRIGAGGGTCRRAAPRCGAGSAAPRTGATRGRASAPSPYASWLPSLTTTSARARCAILTCAWYGLVKSATGRQRTIIRSANGSGPSGRRTKLPPERTDDPVTARDRVKELVKAAVARPPELVRVAVDHPVGAMLGGGEARHAGHPVGLAHLLVRPRGSPGRGRPARAPRARPRCRRPTGGP